MFLHLMGLLLFLDIIQHFIRFFISLLANAQKNLAAYNFSTYIIFAVSRKSTRFINKNT